MTKEQAKQLGLPEIPDRISCADDIQRVNETLKLIEPCKTYSGAAQRLKEEQERRERIINDIKIVKNCNSFEESLCSRCHRMPGFIIIIGEKTKEQIEKSLPHITGGWEEIKKLWEGE